MNALLRPPVLHRESVLREITAGDDTLLKLAETFDVDPPNFTLRRLIAELEDAGLVRRVLRKGQERLLPAQVRRRAA